MVNGTSTCSPVTHSSKLFLVYGEYHKVYKNIAGLHRHISNTSSCQSKSQYKFGKYAYEIWEDGPTL